MSSNQRQMVRLRRGHWVATDADAVAAVLSSADIDTCGTFVGLHGIEAGSLHALQQRWVETVTEPEHRRLRKLVQAALSAETVTLAAEQLTSAARGRLDTAPRDRAVNLHDDVVRPALFDAIAGWMAIEDPVRSDWDIALATVGESVTASELRDIEMYDAAAEQLSAILRDALASTAASTVLGRLRDAEVEGDRLTEAEVIANAANLAVDALPVSELLARSLGRLVREAGPWPGGDWSDTMDSLLRGETSVPYIARSVQRPTTVLGARLRAGDTVYLDLATANQTGRRLFTFGMGARTCLGAGIVRRSLAEIAASLGRTTPVDVNGDGISVHLGDAGDSDHGPERNSPEPS